MPCVFVVNMRNSKQHISGKRTDKYLDALKRPDIYHLHCVLAGNMRNFILGEYIRGIDQDTV